MISDKLKGVLTACVTPVDDQGQIDWAATGDLMAYYTENGIRGVLVPSSTGESFALTTSQRVELVTAAVREGKGKLSILANCSEHNLKDAIRDTQLMAVRARISSYVCRRSFFPTRKTSCAITFTPLRMRARCRWWCTII